jgi:hypothetical protein
MSDPMRSRFRTLSRTSHSPAKAAVPSSSPIAKGLTLSRTSHYPAKAAVPSFSPIAKGLTSATGAADTFCRLYSHLAAAVAEGPEVVLAVDWVAVGREARDRCLAPLDLGKQDMRNNKYVAALGGPLLQVEPRLMYDTFHRRTLWKPFGNHLETLWKPFGNPLETLWKQFGNHLETLWKPFGNPLETIWKPFGNPLETIWKPFGNPLETLWNPLGNPLETLCKPFGNPLETLWKPFGNPLETLWPSVIRMPTHITDISSLLKQIALIV